MQSSAPNEKKERNDIIRELYKNGVDQTNLARRFYVTQCRISAIIHRKLPPYTYCRHCKARFTKALHGNVSSCTTCKAVIVKAREERKAEREYQKQLYREKRWREYYSVLKEKQEIRERSRLQRKIVRILRQVIFAKNVEARHKYRAKREEIASHKFYTWQNQGRERTRFLVRLRDNFTCQDCGEVRTPQMVAQHNEKLESARGGIKSHDVHHLNGECGKRSRKYDHDEDVPGMITLCHRCHFSRHDFSKNIQKEAAPKMVVS